MNSTSRHGVATHCTPHWLVRTSGPARHVLQPVYVYSPVTKYGDTLVNSIPRPETIPIEQEESFRSAAGELFDRVMQAADNAGATDEDRALNYLTVRYPSIYATAADAFGRNESLTAITVCPSSLSGTCNIVDVIFAYTNRNTDVTAKFFCRVDVTEEFPFMVTKMSPYYDR